MGDLYNEFILHDIDLNYYAPYYKDLELEDNSGTSHIGNEQFEQREQSLNK